MTRSTFGGSAADAVWSTQQGPGYKFLTSLVGTPVTMWDAATGGTQLTDLLLGGIGVTSIPAGVGGVLPSFQGPDGVTVLYADGGAGFRVRLDPIGGAGSGNYVQIETTGVPQTVPSGGRMWLKFTDSAVGFDMVDQGDVIADMVDVRVRSTGDGIAVYHDGGSSVANPGFATGNISSFLSIIPFHIDEHGNGRDGTIPNPRWNRTGLWSIVQPPNRNDIAIKAQSWSNVAAVQILNQDPAFAQGNGRAMDIIDKGNDSTIMIQKSVTVGSNGNAKTRKAVLSLGDNSTGGTDPALGTPMQVLGVDDGTGYRFEIDSIGTHRWSVYNAGGFGTSVRNVTNGVLGMPSLAFEDASGNGSLAGLDGIQKINGTHALQVVANGNVQLDVRNGSLGFFGTTAVSARTGWTPATGTATRTTFATGSVTLPVLAEHVKALIDDFHQTAGYGLIRT